MSAPGYEQLSVMVRLGLQKVIGLAKAGLRRANSRTDFPKSLISDNIL